MGEGHIRRQFSASVTRHNGVLLWSVLCFNPLNPIVHFWLHHTAHCAEKIVSARYACWFCVSRKGGTGGGGWVIRRVACTWWLLDLAVKVPWLGPGGPIPAWLH